MAKQAAVPTYLKDYVAPGATIDHLDIQFELDPEHTVVTTNFQVTATTPGAPLILQGEKLHLLEVRIDDNIVPASAMRITPEALIFDNFDGTHRLQIKVAINPLANSTLEGLYVSRDMFCTQCESEGFRKITYFLDRPDVMTTYTTTIIADQSRYPVLLGNGNLMDSRILKDGRKQVTWNDPFKKPSYLFAMVAGKLSFIEEKILSKSGQEKLLQVYVEEKDLGKTRHAMDSLIRSIRWDEEVFGLELDLDRYMIVAVEHFNFGAMENKGLNIFNSKYVLASPETATDDEYEDIESIIGHEYFHNWTGNRVTLRDWFQLCLKEGLTVYRDQKFTSDLHGESVQRIHRVQKLREVQFPEDAGPLSHPVRPSSFMEINNFYTATVYEKGAEILHMLETLLTRPVLNRAIRNYLDQYDGQAATVENFIESISRTTNTDLTQFSNWYFIPGTPKLKIQTSPLSNGGLRLNISQSNDKSDALFHIPLAIGFIDPSTGSEIKLTDTGNSLLQIRQKSETYDFPNVPKNAIPSLGRSFSAPVEISYPYSEAELLLLAQHDSDSFCRWDASKRVTLQILSKIQNEILEGQKPNFPATYIDGLNKIFARRGEDMGLFLEMIVPPSENYLFENLPNSTVESIHEARNFYMKTIATLFEPIWWELLNGKTPADTDPLGKEAILHRSARSLAIAFLAYTNKAEAVKACESMYHESQTMTETLAALGALKADESNVSRSLLDHFYRKWNHEPLLFAKWLQLQSRSELPDVIPQIRTLMRHPSFDLRNPNQVRSLVHVFAATNHFRFHEISGAGYALVEETVTTLNQVNPQLAAGLLKGMKNWRRYDPVRSRLMEDVLRRILELPGISPDVFDVASRCLG